MLSPQEYERHLQEYQRAIQRTPELETRIAELTGLLSEAQATITRQESAQAVLQAERDAAVSRLGAILVGLGTAATILVDLHKGHLPELNAEVEAEIEKARQKAVSDASSLKVVGFESGIQSAPAATADSANGIPEAKEAA